MVFAFSGFSPFYIRLDVVFRQINQRLRKLEKSDSEKTEEIGMLKLDGLTVKLTYENGQLLEAATRGDGDEGE